MSRYYDAFVVRCTELSDWEKLNERIIKGEQKIKRRQVLERVLSEKVSKAIDPFSSLLVPYQFAPKSATAASVRGFNEEEDRFLICLLNNLGYGNWEQMRIEIRKADRFRFNWFMKSRTVDELHRRCDSLIRMLEKEAGESNLVPTWSGAWGAKDNAVAAAAAGGAGGSSSGAGNKRKKPSKDDASVAGSEDVGGNRAKKARFG